MVDTDLQLYSICIILSFVVNAVTIFLLNKKKEKLIGYMLIYENIGFLYGGKLFTYLTNIDKYDGFDFLSIGLSSLGSLIGGMLFLLLFCIQFKVDIKKTMKMFIITIPLMYSIGKIGCFLVGCCYGIEYNGFGNIVYKYASESINGIHLFPVQLVESIVFLIIFILSVTRKYNISFIILISSFSKFILDFLRSGHTNNFISVNQIVCIIFIIVSIIMIRKNNNVIYD